MNKFLLTIAMFVLISCESKREEDLRYKREKIRYIKDLMKIKDDYERKLLIKEIDSIIHSEKQSLQNEKP